MSKNALRLFLSYSHEDDYIRHKLITHLSPLKQQGLIVNWDDRLISGGSDWKHEININLEKADLILLLISSDFINSSYCYGKEMERALARHKEGNARVIPIILRPCYWQKSPFANLQVLPYEGKPITKWSDKDSAYLSVVEGIEHVAQQLVSETTSIVSEWVSSLLLRRKVVRTVQAFLKERGWYKGAVDGEPANIYLREAVRKFQLKAHIKADGLIGPETLRAIMSELKIE